MLNKKKFAKKKIKNLKIKINRILNKIILFFRKKHRKLTYILITLILLFSISPIILSKTFLSQENKISEVKFTPEDVQKFDDEELRKELKTKLIWQNIFIVKYLKTRSLLKDIQKKYNIVKDIKIISSKDKRNEVRVKMEFQDLSLLFNDGTRNIWVVEDSFYILNKDTTFLSGNKKIYLPSYVQEMTFFTWFFYKIPEKKLKMQFQEITNFFSEDTIQKIKYIPWWTRTILELKSANLTTGEQRKLKNLAENDIWFGKKIFFNNTKDISKQLNLYLLTKQEIEKWNMPNVKFDQIKEIDLWGLDYVVICIDEWGCLKR